MEEDGLVKFNDDGLNEMLLHEVKQLALLGLTQEQMCKVWNINSNTFSKWLHVPEFREAYDSGKTRASAKVAESLFKRAVGYDYYEDHVNMAGGKPIISRIQKHLPPDPWSCVRFLSIKERALWSETHHSELTQTNININKFDLSGFSTEDLEALKRIGLNQLSRNATGSQ
jgi:hypothetical protein